jgi:hypothetical protein
MHFTVSDPEVNGPVPPAVFRVPEAARAAPPMTLEELKQRAPWKDRPPDSPRMPWPAP